ncbi:hypothetical protein AAVH_30784, partial [Aphelenchoides avenae]
PWTPRGVLRHLSLRRESKRFARQQSAESYMTARDVVINVEDEESPAPAN